MSAFVQSDGCREGGAYTTESAEVDRQSLTFTALSTQTPAH